MARGLALIRPRCFVAPPRKEDSTADWKAESIFALWYLSVTEINARVKQLTLKSVGLGLTHSFSDPIGSVTGPIALINLSGVNPNTAWVNQSTSAKRDAMMMNITICRK